MNKYMKHAIDFAPHGRAELEFYRKLSPITSGGGQSQATLFLKNYDTQQDISFNLTKGLARELSKMLLDFADG